MCNEYVFVGSLNTIPYTKDLREPDLELLHRLVAKVFSKVTEVERKRYSRETGKG